MREASGRLLLYTLYIIVGIIHIFYIKRLKVYDCDEWKWNQIVERRRYVRAVYILYECIIKVY